MTAQLRRYRIHQGRVDQFATEWRDGVAPLRRTHGFRVHGWLVEDRDEFVWLLEHDTRESFAEADAAYYASAERQRLQPDPARLIDEARKDWLIAVS
jgi:heme-degrading monooxygenase HmoA